MQFRDIYFEDTDPGGDGYPVLFIPGWHSPRKFFDGIVDVLSMNGFRCITVWFKEKDDGGISGSLSSIRASRINDLVANRLQVPAAGIVAFSGHGGAIAHKLLTTLPRSWQLGFLSLLAPTPCFIDSQPRQVFWNYLPANVKASLMDARQEDLWDLVQKSAKHVKKAVEITGSHSLDEVMREMQHMLGEMIGVRELMMSDSGVSYGAPVQIICGELDDVVPVVLSYKLTLILGDPDFRVLPLAGHYFPADLAEETAACIMSFIDRDVAGSRNSRDVMQATTIQ